MRGAKITVSQSIKLYRKFKPTNIFTGREMLAGQEVLIVAENGLIEVIVPATEAGDGVEEMNGVLCPGMVNAHCHIELSHMKGLIPEGTGLVEFVKQVITKRDTPHSPAISEAVYHEMYEQLLDEKLRAMTRAVEELYQSGTVAVGDICNTADSVELKKHSPLYWHNFIEVSGFVDAVAEKRLKFSEEVLATFIKSQPLNFSVGNSLTPHAPYSVSKSLFKLLNDKTTGQLISIHNQETTAENSLFQSKEGDFLPLYELLGIPIDGFAATGKTSLQSWIPYFNQGQKMMAVHNTFTSQADIKFAAEFSQSGNGIGQAPTYCICVNANLYIEKTLPPLKMLLENNCKIVLGTDSYASNGQLNLMAEIRTLRKHFSDIPLASMLQWATLNGAEALGIDAQFGSFEKGKKPGLVLINTENETSQRVELMR